jgi:hypothetical protein
MSTKLDELHMAGRLLYTGCAAWLLGKPMNMKVRGTAEQISALTEVLTASRAFETELQREGATTESVVELLENKRAAARLFHSTFGVPWPL